MNVIAKIISEWVFKKENKNDRVREKLKILVSERKY